MTRSSSIHTIVCRFWRSAYWAQVSPILFWAWVLLHLQVHIFCYSHTPTDFNENSKCSDLYRFSHVLRVMFLILLPPQQRFCKKMAKRYFRCKTFSYIHLWLNIPLKCINYPWTEEQELDIRRLDFFFFYNII